MKKNIAGIILIWIYICVSGQPLDRQVVVTKDFDPIIQNANKINKQPGIKDTIQIKPGFDYRVYPIPAKSTFEIKPIKAAKLVGIPVSELYRYEIKAGMGNHHLPFLQVRANNLRSDDYNLGAELSVNNVEGKIRLANDQKVNAARNMTRILGYGKKIFPDMNLEGKMGMDMYKSHFYGFSIDTIYDPIPKGSEIRQSLNTFFAESQLYSTRTNPGYSFDLGVREAYTWDKFDHYENDVFIFYKNKIKTNLFNAHIDLSFQNINKKTNNDSIYNTSLFGLKPYIKDEKSGFRYMIGFEIVAGVVHDETASFFYPLAGLEYDLAGSILTGYFDLKGNLATNTLKEIYGINPYIRPGALISPSSTSIDVSGGLKGFFTKSMAYNVSGGIRSVEDQVFFINDSVGEYDNYYSIIYDNLDIASIGFEVSYEVINKIRMSLKGNKYKYLNLNEEQAWHMPEWDMEAFIEYNLQNKITLNTSFAMKGKRYAKGYNDEVLEMDPYALLNLNINYHFSKALSAFFSVQNISATQYEIWHQYPNYKTMVLIGGAYRF